MPNRLPRPNRTTMEDTGEIIKTFRLYMRDYGIEAVLRSMSRTVAYRRKAHSQFRTFVKNLQLYLKENPQDE